MKYLRLTARPPPELAPRAFRLLATSDHVDVARAVALDVAGEAGPTGLFHVRGDREALLAGLAAAPEAVATDTAPAPDGGFYLLLSLDRDAISPMDAVFEALARERLVVVPPVMYRDGGVHVQLVGEAQTIGAIVEAMPPMVDVEAHEVGERGLAVDSPAATLSDRQREAVLAALDLGYYDQPRRATHEDVAAELGCAPSTVSEHLQKAEAKLVRAAMD